MAERRSSANVDVGQSDGDTLKAKNHVTCYPVIYRSVVDGRKRENNFSTWPRAVWLLRNNEFWIVNCGFFAEIKK